MKRKQYPQPQSDYKWEAERVRDRTPVKGIFRFHEVPGGLLPVSFRKYKGDPIFSQELRDGEIYELPLGVAVHLQESGWYPVHRLQIDEAGRPSKVIGKKVKRYTFEPLEFLADERMHAAQNDKQIVTVSNI